MYVNRKISEVDISNSTNRDYLMILKIIAKNCDGTITKEFIEKASNINVNKDGTNYIKSDKEKLRYVISLLSNITIPLFYCQSLSGSNNKRYKCPITTRSLPARSFCTLTSKKPAFFSIADTSSAWSYPISKSRYPSSVR